MTILICCYLAAALALGRPHWWRDVAAAVQFVFAALSVEKWLVDRRRAGRRLPRRCAWRCRDGALPYIVLLVAGYLALRFAVLDVGTPSIGERSSGFGFSVLEPNDLRTAVRTASERVLSLYNVGTSILSGALL
jgi:hypothetical protein